MGKIEQIKDVITKAEKRESKLSKEALEVPSMTSLNIRHLLNNLGGISTNYLEVGTHKGGHFCSVGYNNNLNRMVAIDNYSEFYKDGETKKEFFQNSEQFIPKETKWSLIEEDCFIVKDLPIGYFDFYNFDGQHTESSQQRAVSCFLPNLTKEFIFVVDDWAFNGVERGTRTGIMLAGLEVLFEQVFTTPDGGEPNEFWHNAYAVFLLKQK
jgi:hypothetical protein